MIEGTLNKLEYVNWKQNICVGIIFFFLSRVSLFPVQCDNMFIEMTRSLVSMRQYVCSSPRYQMYWQYWQYCCVFPQIKCMYRETQLNVNVKISVEGVTFFLGTALGALFLKVFLDMFPLLASHNLNAPSCWGCMHECSQLLLLHILPKI